MKYEDLYLRPPKDGLALHYQLDKYFDYYNHERRHSSIGDCKPEELFKQQLKVAA